MFLKGSTSVFFIVFLWQILSPVLGTEQSQYRLIGSDWVELGKSSNEISPNNNKGSSACEPSHEGGKDGSFCIAFCNCFVRMPRSIHSSIHSFMHSFTYSFFKLYLGVRWVLEVIEAMQVSENLPWRKLRLSSPVYTTCLTWNQAVVVAWLCPLCRPPHHRLWTGVERSPTVVANWLLH